MNTSPTILETTIHTLGGLGDGIGTYEGQSVFVPKSCVGDQLRVAVDYQNREGIFGRIDSVIAPGPNRTTPPCPHFEACGGCALQHLSPYAYRAFKQSTLSHSLRRVGYEGEAPLHTVPTASRRRVEWHIAGQQLAYHAPRSHRLSPISQCLILTPELQSLSQKLNDRLGKIPQATTIQATQGDEGIELIITHQDALPQPILEKLAQELNLARIATRTGDDTPRIAVTRAPMQVGGIDLPPGAFLQASAQAQQILTTFVLESARGALVLDLFAGIGTYSLPLSTQANVLAIEGEKTMVQALQAHIRTHQLDRLKTRQQDLFKQPVKPADLDKFDTIILNPPRAGAKAQCEQIAASNAQKITMISCNPATFVRDIRILQQAGFSIEKAMGVDQFIYSPHLELAATLSRA